MYRGTRAGTFMRWAERNRGETMSTYKYERPMANPAWLGLQVEVCLETYPAFNELWRRRHNGHTEGDLVRLETQTSHATYPYRKEEVHAYLCSGKGCSEHGGSLLARFYAIGCNACDPGGGGFRVLGDEDRDEYMMQVYTNDMFHRKEDLEEKSALLGCRLHFEPIGKPFRPTRSWTGMFYVRWGFADIYNTLFHPSISEVLAQAHHESHWKFISGLDLVSVYLKMFGRVQPNAMMEVFLFLDEATLTEVYIFKNFEDKSAAWAGCAMFDPAHATMVQEPMVCAMAHAPHLMAWLKGSAVGRVDNTLDLSVCKKA